MISVIIPVYQREKIISNILEDILKQTYQEYEVLVIDDGSTDKTVDICKRYEKKDNRIHVYELQHGGVGTARNAGISFAKGEEYMRCAAPHLFKNVSISLISAYSQTPSPYILTVVLFLSSEGKNTCPSFENDEIKKASHTSLSLPPVSFSVNLEASASALL